MTTAVAPRPAPILTALGDLLQRYTTDDPDEVETLLDELAGIVRRGRAAVRRSRPKPAAPDPGEPNDPTSRREEMPTATAPDPAPTTTVVFPAVQMTPPRPRPARRALVVLLAAALLLAVVVGWAALPAAAAAAITAASTAITAAAGWRRRAAHPARSGPR